MFGRETDLLSPLYIDAFLRSEVKMRHLANNFTKRPTNPFTDLDHRNPLIDVSEQRKASQYPDLKALKLFEGRFHLGDEVQKNAGK